MPAPRRIILTTWVVLLSAQVCLGRRSLRETKSEKFEHVNGRIYTRSITLSGSSTGSTFAQILHLAHSQMFSGLGNFVGFFYKCGGFSESLEEHYAKCGVPGGFSTKDFEPDANLSSVKTAMAVLKSLERQKLVDPFTKLMNQKVWIWIASMDQWIPPTVAAGVVDIYERYLRKPTQIRSVIQSSTHHLPTLSYGAKCDQISDPQNDALLGNCRYNGPKEMLDFLLSGDSFQVKKPKKDLKLRKLLEFDQTRFYRDFDSKVISLDEKGYIYVPSKCESKDSRCYLHAYFHGCFTSRDDVVERHVMESGFLEVAETNGIIVLFPQAKKSVKNPYACWDAFGYTGQNFAQKEGMQVRVARRMLSRFLD